MTNVTQNIEQLPNGKFGVTDAKGQKQEYATRQEAEAALRQAHGQSGQSQTRDFPSGKANPNR